MGHPHLDSPPEGDWFCSNTCEAIAVMLKGLLGRNMPLGGGYTWSILKDEGEGVPNLSLMGSVDEEAVVEIGKEKKGRGKKGDEKLQLAAKSKGKAAELEKGYR
jgi:hypothetical protein